jgi:hypothetical protein
VAGPSLSGRLACCCDGLVVGGDGDARMGVAKVGGGRWLVVWQRGCGGVAGGVWAAAAKAGGAAGELLWWRWGDRLSC